MSFDPKRPCGTHTRAANRYTRSELEGIARKYKINPKGKTMDELCKILKEKTGSEKVVSKPLKFPPQEDPFSSLVPGVLEGLNNKLEKPGGLLLTYNNQWKFLDLDLKELRSFEVKNDINSKVSKLLPFPSGDRFLGVGPGGINVFDLGGKIVQTVLELHGPADPRNVIWATLMDSDTVLYTRINNVNDLGEGESLTSYSLGKREEKFLDKTHESTNGLFRFNDTRYIRFAGTYVAVGDIVSGRGEIKKDLKVPISNNTVVRMGPGRFLTYSDKLQLVEIPEDIQRPGKVSVGGEAKINVTLLGNPFLPRHVKLTCATALDPDTVVMSSDDDHTSVLYFFNVRKRRSHAAYLYPGTIGSHRVTPLYFYPGTTGTPFKCALASHRGKVFGNVNENKFATNAMYGVGPEKLHDLDRVPSIPSFGVEVAPKFLTYTQTRLEPTGQTVRSEVPILVIDVLQPIEISTPEYTAAVKVTVKLMNKIPKDLQGVVAGFLL